MTERRRKSASIGSTLDAFLKEEGTYEATEAIAIKRVLARQIEQAMHAKQLNCDSAFI